MAANEDEFEVHTVVLLFFMTTLPETVIVNTPDESSTGLFLFATQIGVICGTFLNHIAMYRFLVFGGLKNPSSNDLLAEISLFPSSLIVWLGKRVSIAVENWENKMINIEKMDMR